MAGTLLKGKCTLPVIRNIAQCPPGTHPGRHTRCIRLLNRVFFLILSINLKFDGKSILPLLKNPSTDWPDRNIVIQAHRGDKPMRYHNFAIRNQRWKLVHASSFHRERFEGDPKSELYDIPNDPYEMRDVAAEHSEIVEQLKQAYDKWFYDDSHTRPDNYAPPRIHIAVRHTNILLC